MASVVSLNLTWIISKSRDLMLDNYPSQEFSEEEEEEEEEKLSPLSQIIL